ncbi:MAG: hypothetical protein SGJ27_03925 [Candidatus Melainabacteria bacterium]|nr:hypothetical protein [Candidatus Melainabacteria bacterium]
MRIIPKERILRVNCAGYGTEAHWNLGRAKSLNNYSAIIVNPVSIAHLFDKDPELVRKVEQCLAEGNTTLTIDDDLLLRNLAAEIDSRVLELSDFLTQGGVLVYFLCRPFIIQGPSLALDNYYWLESLAPDQPAERNVRHMSAVSHGRLIEPTDDGSISEFAPYLQQPGLEWSTLIRTEYLTEGYTVMAEAGSKKCIAGQLFIVESSGKVVFLPSPYSPDFDKTLIDALNGWYTLKEQSPEELEAEQFESSATAATIAAQATPDIGSGLFEREQSQYEPVAGVMVDPVAQSTQSGNFEVTSADAASATPEPEPFSFNADKIAESVSQDARRFEEEVANRVAREPKKSTTSIDLSIFAQTARQLVQKTTDSPAAAQEEQSEAPGVESGSFAPVAQTPEQDDFSSAQPAIEETAAEEVEPNVETAYQATLEEPEQAVEEAADYELPAQKVAPTPESTNAGNSLRNLLSAVTPELPESVKPSMTSPASALLSESGTFSPDPVTPPAVKSKSAASLFSDDDDDFDEPSIEAESPAAASEASAEDLDANGFNPNQREVETSDQNSGVYSSATPLADSGVYNSATPVGDSGVFSSSSTQPQSTGYSSEFSKSTDSGFFGQQHAETASSNSGAYGTPAANSSDSIPATNSGVYDQKFPLGTNSSSTLPQLNSPTSSSSSLPQLNPQTSSSSTLPQAVSPTSSSSNLPQLNSPTSSSSNLQQVASPTSSSSSLPQVPSPTSSSSSLPQVGTGSGDFNTVRSEEPASSEAFNQVQPAAQEPFYSQPAPPAALTSPSVTTPPPAEPAILQPPSGFMSNFAAQNASQQVEKLPPAEPPMPQTPVPFVSSAGDNSAVTNNDPSNHDNKSTMDLLRELEKAQRPPDQVQPQAAPAETEPDADGVRPLLSNLFKKDATEPPVYEITPPAVPQSGQPAVPPRPIPTRNTLGALMQPAAESRVTVPQESLAMNREGSNAMSNMVVPDWCKQYSFSYLDELKKEQATLASELQDIQAKLNTVESKIASVEQLKSALLSGDGDSLKEATGLVLGKLGWTININNAAPNEVLLLNVDQPEALVRIVRSEAHCDRSEVAQVSGSAIAFWEKHDIEPKGLLIACTWANVSPGSRNQKDFEEPVAEFAKKKNLCLITSIQMLGIYRDLELGLVTPDVVRRQMLETNGLLGGYAVESAMAGARA